MSKAATQLSPNQRNRIHALHDKGFGPKDISKVVGADYQLVKAEVRRKVSPEVVTREAKTKRELELVAIAKGFLRQGVPEAVVRANFGDVL